MADLDESAQDSLLDAALHATKDDDVVLGDISGVDPAVDDSLEDPVTMHFMFWAIAVNTVYFNHPWVYRLVR